MNKSQSLKTSRDLLLKLHKVLVDYEKERYSKSNGPVTPGQFLNQLIENPDLAWLRRFSTLIVEIDEMFAQKDGFDEVSVDAHLSAIKSLLSIQDRDREFGLPYESALEAVPAAAAMHREISAVLGI